MVGLWGVWGKWLDGGVFENGKVMVGWVVGLVIKGEVWGYVVECIVHHAKSLVRDNRM